MIMAMELFMSGVKNILLFMILSFANFAYAKKCFLIEEKGKTVQSIGDCKESYTPQSTFKVALSVIGFDSGNLTDENLPIFKFKPEYSSKVNVCNSDHSPRTWMRDSCVWYSKELTKKMDLKVFETYVKKFDYGNKDVSGDAGKNNGLTNAWLNSSLSITPLQQIKFLTKLANQELPASKFAQETTKKIMFIQELPGGWKLYGKTGNGQAKGAFQHGWFVGWIEKADRKLVFASVVADDVDEKTYASFRSRNEALLRLWDVIQDLEK